MTFAAITKNIKSMYSSNNFEAIPRKSMLEGYKRLNRTHTD